MGPAPIRISNLARYGSLIYLNTSSSVWFIHIQMYLLITTVYLYEVIAIENGYKLLKKSFAIQI